eukprot:353069-Chlamydomonas_euryale.AAC.2
MEIHTASDVVSLPQSTRPTSLACSPLPFTPSHTHPSLPHPPTHTFPSHTCSNTPCKRQQQSGRHVMEVVAQHVVVSRRQSQHLRACGRGCMRVAAECEQTVAQRIDTVCMHVCRCRV